MSTSTFEEHPIPDGFAISHEEIVERLRDLAFRLSVDEAMDTSCGAGDDVETLNLAISALGGTPVKLSEAGPDRDETHSETEETPF